MFAQAFQLKLGKRGANGLGPPPQTRAQAWLTTASRAPPHQRRAVGTLALEHGHLHKFARGRVSAQARERDTDAAVRTLEHTRSCTRTGCAASPSTVTRVFARRRTGLRDRPVVGGYADTSSLAAWPRPWPARVVPARDGIDSHALEALYALSVTCLRKRLRLILLHRETKLPHIATCLVEGIAKASQLGCCRRQPRPSTRRCSAKRGLLNPRMMQLGDAP